MEKMEKILRKIENGRTYRKVMSIEVRAKDPVLKDEDNTMVVEGYATTFNDPYELYRDSDFVINEQVDARAFEECDMSDVIMQYDHQGRVFARMSNNTLEVTPDEKGLHIRANLGGTEMGRQLYEEIKGGYTNKMSFGFVVAEDERKATEDYETGVYTLDRTITRISKLYDVSAVSLPANDATEISARNFGEGVIEEIKAERLKRANVKKLETECLALLNL